MEASNVLDHLGAALVSGGVEVVDCSGVLGPETPILQLPEDFAKNTPKVEIHRSVNTMRMDHFLRGTGWFSESIPAPILTRRTTG